MLALGVGRVGALGVVDLVSGAGLVLLPVRKLFRDVEEHVAAVFVTELDQIDGGLAERVPREHVVFGNPDAVEERHDGVLVDVGRREDAVSGFREGRRFHCDHLDLVGVPQQRLRREVGGGADVRLENGPEGLGELELLQSSKLEVPLAHDVHLLGVDHLTLAVKGPSEGRLHVRVDEDEIRSTRMKRNVE